MFAVQHRLPLVRPRMRSARRPFHPSQDTGVFRLPHEVRDRLASSLAPFRNRDAAFALALFLARFWSAPGRVVGSFPIDRRALADRRDLGLTEKRVRSAIRTLEEIGFLDRAVPPPGSKYKPTPDGLHRRPIMYAFGSEYAPAFIAANEQARTARGAGSRERRPVAGGTTRRPSVAFPEASKLKGPKSSAAEKTVLMGPVKMTSTIPPQASKPEPHLEAALERLKKAIGIAEAGGNGGSRS